MQTQVFWLQGPGFFIDLRQPVGRPSFHDVACLRDLRLEQLEWLAAQEGFAGVLEVTGDVAEWHRHIDFQPDSRVADRARLRLDGEFLAETGVEAAYTEHWIRGFVAAPPCWGVRLTDPATGRGAYLVRVGCTLMIARPRAVPLSPHSAVRSALRTMPSLAAKQDILDFEISIGKVDPFEDAWLIEHSTLPFKEGRQWRIAFDPDHPDFIEIGDIDAEGRSVRQRWRIGTIDSASLGERFSFTAAMPAQADFGIRRTGD